MLRGLVGAVSPGEELAQEWESFRMVMLRTAMEEEMEIDYLKVVHQTFGSFEQEPTGHIRAGSLTKSRREAFVDLVSIMRPFEGWTKPVDSGTQTQHGDEAGEREEFVKTYREWTEKGGPVVSTRLSYSDATPSS
jgi:hypothetical protein